MLERYGFAESEIAGLLNAGVIRVSRAPRETCNEDRKVSA
jgi:hypothetical protein